MVTEAILKDLREKFSNRIPHTTDALKHAFCLEKTLKEIKQEYIEKLDWDIEDYRKLYEAFQQSKVARTDNPKYWWGWGRWFSAQSKSAQIELLKHGCIFALQKGLLVAAIGGAFSLGHWFLGRSERKTQAIYQDWQVINSAQGKSGSGGRIQAIQDLYKQGESMVGLSAPKGAYLEKLNLASHKKQQWNPFDSDLSADLSRANLSDANLSNADLSGANLHSAHLSSAHLSRAHFVDADLGEADLSRADLLRSDLSNADLSNANLHSAEFSSAHLSSAHFVGADLSNADLSNADLSDANLSFAHLHSALLDFADLSRADLSNADLHSAKLSNAHLSEADLSKAHLSEADLSKATLSEADLSEADLSRAILLATNLRGADLSHADLSEADLSNADLSRAILLATNLRGATNFDLPQPGGKQQPLLCNVALPEGFKDKDKLKDRDCDRVPQELLKREPQLFQGLEAAKKYVDEARQKKWK